MNNKTYNLDFTITHSDNLVFEVDASNTETALVVGLNLINDQMEGFSGGYEAVLNSCVEQVSTYTPFQSQVPSSQEYVSLSHYYSTTSLQPQSEVVSPPVLSSTPGYTRLVN